MMYYSSTLTGTKRIIIIAAVANGGVIGSSNKLPWNIPDDMEHFKTITNGNSIIMGRRTFESIGRILPNRENIVITHDQNYQHDGAVIKHSLQEGINYAESSDIFIIGGENIYRQSIHIADTMHITRIYDDFNGDAYFPIVDSGYWEEKCRKPLRHDAVIIEYARK